MAELFKSPPISPAISGSERTCFPLIDGCPKLGNGKGAVNDWMWVIRAAFGYQLRSVEALAYLYTLLYPSLCNSLTDGLHGDAKSMT